MSTYISVPNMGPWYVVVLPTTHRDYLSEANRFTLKVASPEEVEDAHKDFSEERQAAWHPRATRIGNQRPRPFSCERYQQELVGNNFVNFDCEKIAANAANGKLLAAFLVLPAVDH
jgi:hypothetical protein